VDPFALVNTPVAAFPATWIDNGYLYDGLTRDDVAGLRYLYTSNNIVTETTAAGSSQLVTNSVAPVLQTTEPFSALISAAQTTDPAILQTMYPGLEIATSTNFFVDQVTTNVSIYYTNTPGATITNFQPFQLLATMDLGLFSELSLTDSPAQMQALYPGLVVVSSTNFVTFPVTTNISYYYTNTPGPAITNYQPLQLQNTLDLGLFTSLVKTDSPAQLLALYPGLIIVSDTDYYTNIPTPNLVTYYKEPNGAPAGTLPVAVTVTNGYTANWLLYYNYVFGNIYTNSYSSNSYETIQTVTVQVPNGSPVGTLGVTNTTTTTILVHQPGGDFFILNTNWCGFKLFGSSSQPTISTSNTVTLSNLVSGVYQFTGTQTTTTSYTNHTFVIEPGTCEPTLVGVTNYATNVVVQYQTTFANLVTNSYSSNTVGTLTVTNIGPCTNGLVGVLCTNITTQPVTLTNVPSGEFFILPTNWCGYDLLYSNVLTTPPTPLYVYTTNTVAAVIPPGIANIGQQYTASIITVYTNHTYVIEPGTCEPALAYATNYTTNIVVQYQTTFANLVTNFYSSNSLVTIITTNIGACPGGMVGTLCTNITTQQVLTNVPTGDFFIPPAAWCGYTILSNYAATPVYVTNTVAGVIPPGIADIGQQYTVTTISLYTNHTFLIAPLNCTTRPLTVALREGIENIKYVRANYDSLITQFFQPITNNYTMVAVSNSQPVLQYIQRVITAPDILLTAQDRNGFGGGYGLTRNINFNQANILPGLAGPGTIDPPTTITLNRAAPFYFNSYENALLNTNAFVNPGESTQTPVFAWGSFDTSTNYPIVYPNGTSIVNLENQLLVQITPPPPVLPNGTNNVAYAPVTFTATGGPFSPPFTWTLAANMGTLPQGLSLSTTGTISGTPTNNVPGTYDFVIQLNDSLTPPRTVTWDYSITIPQ
jgi:hypothetical protein